LIHFYKRLTMSGAAAAGWMAVGRQLPQLLLLLLLLLVGSSRGSSWNYNLQDEEHGPHHWTGVCNKGERQSPINFPATGLEKGILPELQFENYHTAPDSMTLLNNGHAAKISFTPASGGDPPLVLGGGLQTTYRLAQIHFHWGSVDDKGSEHTVANQSYPLEMHMVHFKHEHEDILAALKDPSSNTLAVLGVFFELAEEDNPNLGPILEGLQSVQDYHQTAQITPFPLLGLLPEDMSKFFRYNGSLTTPACNQIVTWTVAQAPLQISINQLEKFRQLKDQQQEPLVDNYRPIQKINNRRVIDVTTFSDNDNAGAGGHPLADPLAFASVLPLVLHATSMLFF